MAEVHWKGSAEYETRILVDTGPLQKQWCWEEEGVSSPNERCSTDNIVNKGSKRMGGTIDAAEAEESKLGFSWWL